MANKKPPCLCSSKRGHCCQSYQFVATGNNCQCACHSNPSQRRNRPCGCSGTAKDCPLQVVIAPSGEFCQCTCHDVELWANGEPYPKNNISQASDKWKQPFNGFPTLYEAILSKASKHGLNNMTKDTKIEPGCIVWAFCPFSDMRRGKVRPCLVIKPLPYNDYLVVEMTSNPMIGSVKVLLEDFIGQPKGFYHRSNVTPTSLIRLNKSVISGTIGKVKPEKLAEVMEAVGHELSVLDPRHETLAYNLDLAYWMVWLTTLLNSLIASVSQPVHPGKSQKGVNHNA